MPETIRRLERLAEELYKNSSAEYKDRNAGSTEPELIFVNDGGTDKTLDVLFEAQLFCIGLLREYIGRIYKGAKERPLYIVEKYCACKNEKPT